MNNGKPIRAYSIEIEDWVPALAATIGKVVIMISSRMCWRSRNSKVSS
ncbi:DUF3360 domain-containing protein [Vibrio parahaemolyticus]|nr:DUF3360 domain-containing protein [Vibrio parahaemolyticus]